MLDRIQILLVDDEPRVLRGLHRQLVMADEWEILAAESGSEALAILADHPCDVLVTDIRMPGMDGEALLREVRERYPQTIRMALSGQTDKEMALRAVGLAHQFLAKPCEPETLKSTLTQAVALRRVLNSPKLKQLVSKLKTLPSPPNLFNLLIQEIQSPQASIKKIGQIIAQDIGMTAKMLQLVNSAFFGLRRHISDPTQAVMLLGLDTIKALTLSVHIFSQFGPSKLGGVSLTQLQKHSLAVATLAKRIAEVEQVPQQFIDHTFTAGLLHDVGQLILATNLPDEYNQVLNLVHTQNLELLEAERQVFTATHPEVGAYLLGIWGLPSPVVEALAFHHDPLRNLNKQFSPLTLVHTADVLTCEARPCQDWGVLPQIDTGYLTELNCLQRLPLWREMSQKIFQEEGK